MATATQLGFNLEITSRDGLVTNNSVTVTVTPITLDFTAVPHSLADVVTVPAGYSVSVLYRLGDPIAAGVPAYANNGTDTNFAQRAGDHHDGMSYFGLAASGTNPDPNNSTRGLLVLNHENISEQYLHVNGQTPAPRPESEAIKEIECHGVSVIEVTRANGLELCARLGAESPHHAEHADGVQRPGQGQRLAEDRLFDRWQRGARYDQQLRQRHDGVEHLSDQRRELGGLFPPCLWRRGGADGDDAEAECLARPLWHRRRAWRQL